MVNQDNSIEQMLTYPTHDFTLPFSDYLVRTRDLIQARRRDLAGDSARAELLLNTNSPYELKPEKSANAGALLIHGLLDCPFSVRDTAQQLVQQGLHCRSILLPGHGTRPEDLLNISYHDWVQAVRYGIESFRGEVDQLFLVGYSTGAALSIYHALQNPAIAGIIMLAPAIKIKEYIDLVIGLPQLGKWARQKKVWIYQDKETDYAKYRSICFNAAAQVSRLTDAIEELQHHHTLNCPIFIAMSRDDETVSSYLAQQFFQQQQHPDSRMLLYSNWDAQTDSRILVRPSSYPQLGVKHLSHICLPYAMDNPHYGRDGDYQGASRGNLNEFVYGAYNAIEVKFYNLMHKLGLAKEKHRELTYNPDFSFMAEQIIAFVQRLGATTPKST